MRFSSVVVMAVALLATNASASVIGLDVQPNAPVEVGDTVTVDIAGLGNGHWVFLFLSPNLGTTNLGAVQLGLTSPITYFYAGYAPLGGEKHFEYTFNTLPAPGLTVYLQCVDCVFTDGIADMATSNVDSISFAP